ncbi:GNAT family N-acetyltransferase [Nocardiopsis sp. MG754419]|uniref:GNAT family N-acetyltransferase n=1 Tax=Nocardiopsis sp. MG754419 TaxID=2259865 RepID=UPI001BA6A22E|nr:GNAT family N-acetyltransferase [Nocardiopsis sp. MG754419]MBR8743032.1 GNAT family N-acetyltransferase [Nocardiopsis sp. MG754419]
MTETARTETVRRETARARILRVEHDDPRVQGLLDGLLEEYTERYGAEGAAHELGRYPVTDFVAPHGRLVLAELDGEIVAGGALRPYRLGSDGTPRTVEFKRIWTSARHRRRGLGRLIMTALEDAARDLGYTSVMLFTGPSQPEAVALYERIGYRWVDPTTIADLPYPKAIPFGHDLHARPGASPG